MIIKRILKRYLSPLLIALISSTALTKYTYATELTTVISGWITTADRTAYLQEVTGTFSTSKNQRLIPIIVDPGQQFQTIDGFGFALTGGSAELLMKMSKQKRAETLSSLFAPGNKTKNKAKNKESAALSYIRLTIGASDLNSFVFSYNDIKEHESDLSLDNFTLSQDLQDVVPVMKDIIKINPDIKIMASPWSAPAWMKSNRNARGGKLVHKFYGVYADYLIKYIQEMRNHGINISQITIQNEPLNNANTPSMQWQRAEQADFIKHYLGPKIRENNLQLDIILFDHNADRIDYPLALMSDPDVDQYVIGSAFHHYAGDMSALSTLHSARPDRAIFFTEQMVREREEDKHLDIANSLSRIVIGATRNWSKNVILWNLAADPNHDPHTDNGGCPFCQGAITIDGDKVKKNLAFYTIAHASMFVPPGSVRIQSNSTGDSIVSLTYDEENPDTARIAYINNAQVLTNVAFLTPDNDVVLLVANTTFSVTAFQIMYAGQYATITLPPGAVGTFKWPARRLH